MELQRGRLIDHVQLVVADLAASRRFYEAILGVLDIPIEGGGDGFFWADEFVVSSADSEAAEGKLTGRCHLAFQAGDEHRHHARPFGHPVALTFLRRRPEDMAALLTRAGFAPHSRTVREADPALDETAAQAFLIARRGA